MTTFTPTDQEELIAEIHKRPALDYDALASWTIDNRSDLELLNVRNWSKEDLLQTKDKLMPCFRAFYWSFEAHGIETTSLRRLWSSWVGLLTFGGIEPDESFDLASMTGPPKKLLDDIRSLSELYAKTDSNVCDRISPLVLHLRDSTRAREQAYLQNQDNQALVGSAFPILSGGHT